MGLRAATRKTFKSGGGRFDRLSVRILTYIATRIIYIISYVVDIGGENFLDL
jgi:uncharacterized MAPEG superfamily protein